MKSSTLLWIVALVVFAAIIAAIPASLIQYATDSIVPALSGR